MTLLLTLEFRRFDDSFKLWRRGEDNGRGASSCISILGTVGTQGRHTNKCCWRETIVWVDTGGVYSLRVEWIIHHLNSRKRYCSRTVQDHIEWFSYYEDWLSTSDHAEENLPTDQTQNPLILPTDDDDAQLRKMNEWMSDGIIIFQKATSIKKHL
jgi:hypothetical protein